MKRAAKKTKKSAAAKADPRFARVMEAFADDPNVHGSEGKGFGSGALKVKGKIFAMMSSRGQFVVKLPKERVVELVSGGKGERFDPGHGRLMKEWVVIKPGKGGWVVLAEEACEFVKRAK